MSDFTLESFDAAVIKYVELHRFAAEEFDKARHDARLLEGMGEAKLRDIIRNAPDLREIKNADLKKLFAKGSKEYQDYICTASEAQLEADRKYHALFSIQWRMEMLRSRFSFQKSIMSAGG